MFISLTITKTKNTTYREQLISMWTFWTYFLIIIIILRLNSPPESRLGYGNVTIHHVTIILIKLPQTKELQTNIVVQVVGKVSLNQILLYDEHFISDFI